MKITEQNIEQWLSLYESGSLGEEEMAVAGSILEKAMDIDINVPSDINDNLSDEIKASLVRGSSDLSFEQKQIMAIAAKEGDLNADERAEFEHLVINDHTLRREREVFEKITLKPDASELFENKSLLYRNRFIISPAIVYTVSSIAAVLAIALIAGRFLFKADADPVSAQRPLLSQTTDIIPEKVQPQPEIIVVQQTSTPEAQGSIKPTIAMATALPAEEVTTERETINKITATGTTVLNIIGADMKISTDRALPVTLMAVNTADEYEYDSPGLKERFVGAFRQYALGEKEPKASPLTAYEIAGAGLNGVNRLLGWNMELARAEGSDPEHEVLSFNSRLLKFNAPKKVNE